MRTKLITSFLLCSLVLFLFSHTLTNLKQATKETQFQSLQNAVERSISQCYALEGRYPQSLDKLIEDYGLVYNENKFFIDYQPLGENIRPDVTIIEVEP